jgi:hypothetical protein
VQFFENQSKAGLLKILNVKFKFGWGSPKEEERKGKRATETVAM